MSKIAIRNLILEGATRELAVASVLGGVAGLALGRALDTPPMVATLATIGGTLLGAGIFAASAHRAVRRVAEPDFDLEPKALVPPAHPKPARIPEVVSYLRDHLGVEMTAFLSGAESPAVVSRWLSGDTFPEPLEMERMKAARRVVEELAGAYSDDMIKLWFFGKNEWLEDKAPAAVLRHGCRTDDWRQLLPAAEEFAESAY